jgi:hypothetical protein
MNDRCVFGDNVDPTLAYGRGLSSPLVFKGNWVIQHIRQGNLISNYEINNLVTTAGKNSLLDVGFRAQTQISAWYIGLVDNTSFTAFDVSDTMASHAGWIEFYTGYSQSTRVQWSPSAASGGSISNSTAAQFDITATATLKGVFITSGSAKNGTTGTLWSGAAFAANLSVQNGDQLKLTYTVSS